MAMVLQVLVILSGLIEAGLGVWFVIAGRGHPILQWLFGPLAARASLAAPISLFLALACFLAAGLHFLIWRWLRDDRDEAYALINLYGGFAFLSGIALFLAFARTRGEVSPPSAAWVPLALDTLRGALLLAVAGYVRYAPSTLRELRLPKKMPATREARVREEIREGGGQRRYSRSHGRGGRGEAAPAVASRVPAPAMAGRGPVPVAAARPAAPTVAARAPMPPSAPPSRGSEPRERGGDRFGQRAGDPSGERTDDLSRRRTRGRRGGRRGRSGPAMETGAASTSAGFESRPLPPTPTPRPAPAPRSDIPMSGSEPREPREGREMGLPRERRGRREPREGRDGHRRERDERPRRMEPPAGTRFAAVRPPSALMDQSRSVSDAPRGRGVEIVNPAERGPIEAGRRPKRGRYSITGALFRPREKRVHRPLGGAAAVEWGWPKLEEPIKPAPGPTPQASPEER